MNDHSSGPNDEHAVAQSLPRADAAGPTPALSAPPGGIPKVAVYLRLMGQLLALSTPIAMMLIVDKVVTQGARNTLIALLIGVALLTGFQFLFLVSQTLHGCREVEARALPVRRRVLAALLDSPASGRWTSAGWDVVQGAPEGSRFEVETRPQAAADCLFVALLVLLMASFSVALAAVSLLFVPLYLLLTAWAGRHAERHAVACTPLRNGLSAHYLESAAAADSIHALHLAERVLARWDQADMHLAAARCRLALWRRLSSLGVEFLQKVSLLLIMLLGVSSVIAGAMTLGQYIAFNLLSMQLAQPVLRLAAYRRAGHDQQLHVQARRQLEAACREEPWPSSGRTRLPRGGRPLLEVEGVVPRQGAREYPPVVLQGGQRLGIVGASGCGKSTLLRIIAGLEAPHRGRVRLDGVAVSALDPAERAGALHLVPQEPVVMAASIAENIALANPAASAGQILAAAAACGLQPLLEELPDHLNTRVGRGGRALSGGERQRIALARAMLVRPRVLLLDEATAALDTASEAVWLANLQRWLPDTAVVLVAHRPSSLAGCHQVQKLDGAAPSGGVHLRRPRLGA